jgi:4,5-dihydroxyphthalate decarboxylase
VPPPLSLRLGCGDYDRTRPLFEGSVLAEGIALDCTSMIPHELFRRVLVDRDFDVAEISISNHTTLISRGNRDLVGIPVFPSRVYRHGFVFVGTESGIERPQDLIGRRIGVPEYDMTAAVWVRGVLQHDYGVEAHQLRWFHGGLDRPGRPKRIDVEPPPNIAIEPISPDQCLGEMLDRGDLDAVIAPSIPAVVKGGSPRVRRLFPDHRAVEIDYYRRTGIVHLMHTIVVRREVYERDPWVATSLFDAFSRAKSEAYRRLVETGTPRVSLAWLQAAIELERSVFGPDHWPYGFQANRQSLEALVTYVHEQGLADRRVSAEELFAPETLALP